MSRKSEETAELLLGDLSRNYTDMQVDMILEKPELFELYWDQYVKFDGRVSARAAWVITHLVLRRPEIISPYLSDLLRLAPLMKQDAEKRCLAKILSQVSIPDELKGEVIDRCFAWLDNPAEAIAVRVYCIDTLCSLGKEVPEIRGELCATLENHLDRFSRGLKNKGIKTIKALKKSGV